MTLYLDPRGRSSFGIGICARCSKKMFLEELYSDPNYPGLMVCKEDLDNLDPYRLPSRQTERINLDFTRPDLPLTGESPSQSLIYFDLATEDGFFLMTEDLNYLMVEPWAPGT